MSRSWFNLQCSPRDFPLTFGCIEAPRKSAFKGTDRLISIPVPQAFHLTVLGWSQILEHSFSSGLHILTPIWTVFVNLDVDSDVICSSIENFHYLCRDPSLVHDPPWQLEDGFGLPAVGCSL